ncbi:hypothetical protein YPPY103_1001, partial [Yersinia pestis PY-103]
MVYKINHNSLFTLAKIPYNLFLSSSEIPKFSILSIERCKASK